MQGKGLKVSARDRVSRAPARRKAGTRAQALPAPSAEKTERGGEREIAKGKLGACADRTNESPHNGELALIGQFCGGTQPVAPPGVGEEKLQAQPTVCRSEDNCTQCKSIRKVACDLLCTAFGVWPRVPFPSMRSHIKNKKSTRNSGLNGTQSGLGFSAQM